MRVMGELAPWAKGLWVHRLLLVRLVLSIFLTSLVLAKLSDGGLSFRYPGFPHPAGYSCGTVPDFSEFLRTRLTSTYTIFQTSLATNFYHYTLSIVIFGGKGNGACYFRLSRLKYALAFG